MEFQYRSLKGMGTAVHWLAVSLGCLLILTWQEKPPYWVAWSVQVLSSSWPPCVALVAAAVAAAVVSAVNADLRFPSVSGPTFVH